MVSRRNPGGGDNPRPRSLMISNIQAQEEVVSVPDIVETSIVRIIGNLRGKFLSLFSQPWCFLLSSFFLLALGSTHEVVILTIVCPFVPFGITWDQHGFYELVQLIQVDIAADWPHNSPLCFPTQGVMLSPVPHVPCLTTFTNSTDTPSVLDLLSQH